jgi:hypothetical protein
VGCGWIAEWFTNIQLVLISRNGLSGMLVLVGITCIFIENNVWLYIFCLHISLCLPLSASDVKREW